MKNRPAVISLSMVVALGAVALLIVLFAVLAGIDLLQKSHNSVETQETFAGGEGCVNEALLELSSSSSYSGGAVTIGTVNCTVTVSGSGSTRTIDVAATHGSTYTQNIEVEVDVSARPYSILNWEEN